MKDRIIEDWYGRKKSNKKTAPAPKSESINNYLIFNAKHKQNAPSLIDPGFDIPLNNTGISNNTAINAAKILADIYFKGRKRRPDFYSPNSHSGDIPIENLPRALPDEGHIENHPDYTPRGQSIPVQYASNRAYDPDPAPAPAPSATPSSVPVQNQNTGNTSGYGMVDPGVLQAQQAYEKKISRGAADYGQLLAQQAYQDMVDAKLAAQKRQNENIGSADYGRLLAEQEYGKKISRGFADPGLLQAQQAQAQRTKKIGDLLNKYNGLKTDDQKFNYLFSVDNWSNSQIYKTLKKKLRSI
jgi:hypothetical protein